MNYTSNEKRVFRRCRRKYYIRKVHRKLRRKLHLSDIQLSTRYGHDMLELEAVQKYIFEQIESGKPFMAGRLGGVESRAATQAIGLEMGVRKGISPRVSEQAQINAGFFPPTNEQLIKFAHLIQESMKQVDLLGSMQTNYEEFLVRQYMPEASVITNIGNLEPYYSMSPWSKALAGKKVLVIHPFSKTIAAQYKNHNKLFDNPDILPDFDLKALKAVHPLREQKPNLRTGLRPWSICSRRQ